MWEKSGRMQSLSLCRARAMEVITRAAGAKASCESVTRMSSLLPLLAASRLASRLLQADKLPCDFHHTAL